MNPNTFRLELALSHFTVKRDMPLHDNIQPAYPFELKYQVYCAPLTWSINTYVHSMYHFIWCAIVFATFGSLTVACKACCVDCFSSQVIMRPLAANEHWTSHYEKCQAQPFCTSVRFGEKGGGYIRNYTLLFQPIENFVSKFSPPPSVLHHFTEHRLIVVNFPTLELNRFSTSRIISTTLLLASPSGLVDRNRDYPL